MGMATAGHRSEASSHASLAFMNLFVPIKNYFASALGGMLRGSRLPIYLGLLMTLLIFWMHTNPSPLVRSLLERLDSVVYDQRFNIGHGTLSGNQHNIVIVDYDQRSLEAEGQWPWSRVKIGDMVSKLAEDGALVVGFDVFFPEYERNLIKELGTCVQQRDDCTDAASLLPELERFADVLDADSYFANSMQSTDVVLGFSLRKDETSHSGVLPDSIFSIDAQDNQALSLEEMEGYIGNVDTLQNGASGAGYFDTIPDIDGVIRKYNLVLRYQDRVYPSLALDMARLYNLEDRFKAVVERDIQGLNPQMVGIVMGQTRIPTDEDGRVRVPYIGPQGSYPYISATDVLHDTLTDTEREQLKNSLVLVGTTSTGLYDLRATPVQAVYPGVEIHANVLNGILSSAPSITIEEGKADESKVSTIMDVLNQAKLSPFPSRPDWEDGAITVAIVMIGFGLSMIYPYLGPALLALSSITFMGGMMVLNFYLWNRYNLDISLVELLLLILLIAIVNMTYGFLKEGLHRKVIKGMFDQYVPPAHIDAMLNNPDKYNFSGESKELSVLFSDIRNFTTISEKLKATELKALLNEFFTPITGIIFENNGTIDKYVGDMVMAFWGAPLDDPDHRHHAVSAALKMLAKVEELKPLFREKGLPEVNIGIGINSGMMNVGDMGSTYRRAYTVIGDAVNLGSRLESITKTYGVKLLIGEQTYDGLTGVLCRQIDKVQVKGKNEPIRIYQPLCRTEEAGPDLLALVDEYHAAYHLYQQRQWDAATAAFEELKRKDPDTYLYSLYLERIASLRSAELPADWDGTYRYTTK
jgi:adenylate cyclase